MPWPPHLVLLEALDRRLLRLAKVEDLAPVERKAVKKLAALFRMQGRLMSQELEKLRGYFTEAPPPSAWEPAWERTSDQTRDGFAVIERTMLEQAFALGANRLSSDLDLGINFSLKNPRAVAWMEAHGAEMVTGVEDTTRSYINTLMTRAIDEGWSYDKTARTLIDRFEEFAVGQPQLHIDSRAHLIAVTESATAYEQGNALMVGDLMAEGIPMEKAWLTVGDDRVDEEFCGDNEAEGWIPAEGEFQSGDSEPPAHPACRCTAQYQVAGVSTTPEPKQTAQPQPSGTFAAQQGAQ